MGDAYASRTSRRRARCGAWFVTGLLLGLFAAGLTWLKLAPGLAGKETASPPREQSPHSVGQPRPKPRFDFYTILPEMEVVIPEEELRPPARPEGNKTDAAPPGVTHPAVTNYMLQIGSFRNPADADRLKAQLAFIGIEAEVQKVTINNKDTFHRVRSGPYRDQKQLNQVRALLRKNQINSIVIRLRG